MMLPALPNLTYLLTLLTLASASVVPIVAREGDHPAALRREDVPRSPGPGFDPSRTLNPIIDKIVNYSPPSKREPRPWSEDKLGKRQLTEPDWSDVISYQSDYLGFIGQNLAVVTNPGFRAICPEAIAALETCTQDLSDPCEPERVDLEWCFVNRMMWCGSEWWDISVVCFMSTPTDCESVLHNMWECRGYCDPLDPVPSGWADP
ncbi:hypothetical protein DFH27DRAFT_609035 [Peziza echinospora]|nr:hypothetical protein DFH27DRAFT_609035 [Peziza echinospora]